MEILESQETLVSKVKSLENLFFFTATKINKMYNFSFQDLLVRVASMDVLAPRVSLEIQASLDLKDAQDNTVGGLSVD